MLSCYHVVTLADYLCAIYCHVQVQTEEAQQYAQDSDIIYMETSAKTALNVRNLFVEIGMSFNYCCISFIFYPQAFSVIIAKKLPKTTAAPERESFPIVPPKKEVRVIIFILQFFLLMSVYLLFSIRVLSAARSPLLFPPYCPILGLSRL
jgi:hypothetical protein